MDRVNQGHHWGFGIALGLSVMAFVVALVVGLLAYPVCFLGLAGGVACLALTSHRPAGGDDVVRLAVAVARGHDARPGRSMELV